MTFEGRLSWFFGDLPTVNVISTIYRIFELLSPYNIKKNVRIPSSINVLPFLSVPFLIGNWLIGTWVTINLNWSHFFIFWFSERDLFLLMENVMKYNWKACIYLISFSWQCLLPIVTWGPLPIFCAMPWLNQHTFVFLNWKNWPMVKKTTKNFFFGHNIIKTLIFDIFFLRC